MSVVFYKAPFAGILYINLVRVKWRRGLIIDQRKLIISKGYNHTRYSLSKFILHFSFVSLEAMIVWNFSFPFYHRFRWYATFENKTPAEKFPKLPSIIHVIDRSDRNPPITATRVTFRSSLRHASCDGWISTRSVDNVYDWRKFWKRFRGCFVLESRVSITVNCSSTDPFEFGQRANFTQLKSMNMKILRLVWKGKRTPQLFFYIHDNKAFINRRMFFLFTLQFNPLRASGIVYLHEKMSFSFAPTVTRITSDTMFYMFKISTSVSICRMRKFGLVVKTTGNFFKFRISVSLKMTLTRPKACG